MILVNFHDFHTSCRKIVEIDFRYLKNFKEYIFRFKNRHKIDIMYRILRSLSSQNSIDF
jgi:hypothetical protein